MQSFDDESQNLLEFKEKDFPELYQAARDGKIILFLGAGISKLYGCSLWYEIARQLSKDLSDQKVINFAEFEILNRESLDDPRKVISICYELAKEKDKLEIYEKSIKDSLEIEDSNMCLEIYDKIFSIKSLVYLSTNFDLGINYLINHNNKYKNRRIYDLTLNQHRIDIESKNYNILKDGNIIYLHGVISNLKELILPIDKYLQHYNQNNIFLNNFFLEIEKTNCFIIFIGYRLHEWDIIEKIYKMKNSLKERTSILLSPVYSFDKTKFNLEKNYFKSFGVIPVPYRIDEIGYRGIFPVLEKLSGIINMYYTHPFDFYSEIEKI
jgi:hypothetical protein